MEVELTPQLQRVFWSGGVLAKDAAATFAKANSGMALEMTAEGQCFELVTKRMDFMTDAKLLRENASRDFATGAKGEGPVSII